MLLYVGCPIACNVRVELWSPYYGVSTARVLVDGEEVSSVAYGGVVGVVYVAWVYLPGR